MMTEMMIKHAIRKRLGVEPDLVLYPNAVGVARTLDGKRSIRYGLCPGSSDLVGSLAPTGRWFCLEVKTATGRTSDQQDMWLAMMRRHGNFACVARSVDEAMDALERARNGESE